MDLTEQQQNSVNTAIEGMRGEIVLLNNYIGRTLYEEVKEIGSINIVKNENLRDTVKTVLGQVKNESLSEEDRIKEEKRIESSGYNLLATINTTEQKIKKIVEELAKEQLKGIKNELAQYQKEITTTLASNEDITSIKKLAKELEEKHFKGIKNELAQYQKEITTALTSNEGITSIVNDYIKLKGVVENIGLFEKGGKLVADKRDIITLIAKDISINPEIISAGLKDIKLLEPLQHIATLRTTECFAIDGEQNPVYCVLDRAKLTPENIEKFTKLVNHDMKAFSVVQESLKSLGSAIDIEQNIETTKTLLPVLSNLNPEALEKKGSEVVRNLAPLLQDKDKPIAKSTESALAKLDSGYLSEYSAVIAAELKTVNEKGTSLWEKFKSVFTHTDYLAERLEKVTDNYVLKNDEYVEKEINNKIFLNAVKDTEIATGLTKFIEQNKDKLQGLEIITSKPSKKINSKELAKLRKVNPVGFDKALFGQTPSYDKIPPSPPPPPVVQTQKPVTPPTTPSWQQSLKNQGASKRTERRIG